MTKYLFSLLCILLTLSVFAKIVEADSLEEVKRWIGCPNEKTLVLFDIDHTLTIPTCPAFQHKNVIRYEAVLNQMGWSEEEETVITNLADLDYRLKLLDPQSVAYIQTLQRHHIPTMAFTSAMTGWLGKIKDILSWRGKQLLHFGIDFSKTAPYLPRFQLNDIEPFLETYPEGACGILCANHREKGSVLKSFLKYIDWIPEKVFLVDDTLAKLESMIEPMKSLGIDYIGIHFLAKHSLKVEPIDEATFLAMWLELKKEADLIIKKRRGNELPSILSSTEEEIRSGDA